VEVAFLAAVMRHELEHCRQWEAGSNAYKLYSLVDQVIQLVCGDDEARAGELINTQPIEGNANAASSAYLRRRYPEAIPALAAGEDHFLADWIDPPGQPEQLVERTFAFLHQFADICNDREGLPVNTRLPTSSTCDWQVAVTSGGGSTPATEWLAHRPAGRRVWEPLGLTQSFQSAGTPVKAPGTLSGASPRLAL